VKSLAAMKTLIRELLVAFPDWHVTVEDMFGEDNKVVTRWNLRATHLAPYHDIPATGLKIIGAGPTILGVMSTRPLEIKARSRRGHLVRRGNQSGRRSSDDV